MNNFKKVLSLLLVAFFALILVGCGGNDAEKAAQQEIEENLEQLYVTGLEDALNDLALPKYFKGDKKKTITWESDSDSLVITEYDDGDDNKNMFFKGKIVLKKEGHNFKLTATLKYEYEEGKFVSGTKEFKGNVVADEWADNNYETIAAAKSTEGKTSNESKIKFQGTVTFTTDAGYIVSDKTGSIYVYGSSHGRKVGEKVTVRGVWASYNNMPQVTKNFIKDVLNGKALNFPENFYTKYKDIIPSGWKNPAAKINNNYSYDISKDLYLVTGFHADSSLPGVERDFNSNEILWIAPGMDYNRVIADTYSSTYSALYDKYR